jgi:Right handed beta helix region
MTRPRIAHLSLTIVIGLFLLWEAGALAAKEPSPVFFSTQNSDEWVDHSIHVQNRYARVLVVASSGNSPKSLRVPSLFLNSRDNVNGPEQQYSVSASFRTLQEAADAAQGGDLVAVMPGHYSGFVIEDKPSAGDERYIHFRAMGEPGDVVIDQPSRVPDWMILLRAAHHVIIQGFNIAGSNQPGQTPSGPRAGIMLDGEFRNTGKQVHHVVLVGNFSHNHRKWGFHTRDTHTVLIQDNLFALSAMEHSGYVSNGSDNYVIRRNIFFGSNSGGLQCNLDPLSSLEDLVKKPELQKYPKEQPTREWALGLIKLANDNFGVNNFPDGRGVNFIIEDNVINENGKVGGGSLNLAGLQDSLIQNNLIYDNRNHGIAQWNDQNPYDQAQADPGPTSPNQVHGPDDLPLWGCHNNLIRNNTVLMSNRGRAAMQSRNGSWGTRTRNNIFINDQPSSIEIFNTSTYRLDSSFDVINTVAYHDNAGDDNVTEMPSAMKSLATQLPEGPHTIAGITQERAAKEFVRYSNEPWVIIEGKWWRLNPHRPDFRPRADSKLFANWGDPKELPDHDLAGAKRTAPAMGAYEPASRDAK